MLTEKKVDATCVEVDQQRKKIIVVPRVDHVYQVSNVEKRKIIIKNSGDLSTYSTSSSGSCSSINENQLDDKDSPKLNNGINEIVVNREFFTDKGIQKSETMGGISNLANIQTTSIVNAAKNISQKNDNLCTNCGNKKEKNKYSPLP